MSNLTNDSFLQARKLMDTGWTGPTIVESLHIPSTRPVWRCRERHPPKSWWRRILFWPPFVSFWQATLVEFYEHDEPHFYVDTINNRILCHPANAQLLRDQLAKEQLRHRPHFNNMFKLR